MIDNNVCSRSWGELVWSPWTAVSGRGGKLDVENEGVYRVRITGDTTLVYIGQSRNLPRRIGQLRRSMRAQDPTSKHPVGRFARAIQWCAPELTFEVSAATQATKGSRHLTRHLRDKRQRLSVEKYLMWRHRIETGISASCNHARTGQARYQHSLYPEGDDESPQVSTPGIQNSHHALPATRCPADLWWMGIEWEPFFSIHDPFDSRRRYVYRSSLYKVMAEDLETMLAVGYAENTWDVIRPFMDGLLKQRSIHSVASVHQLHPGWCKIWRIVKYRCLEMRDDLLGGYHHHYGAPPVFQFCRSELHRS